MNKVLLDNRPGRIATDRASAESVFYNILNYHGDFLPRLRPLQINYLISMT